jgi:hypothetical protein
MSHKRARDDLTAKFVRSILSYDPETGVLTWKNCSHYHPSKNGKPAGVRQPRGCIQVKINRRSYLAHRLIWLMMTGRWPPQEIDHIDRDPSNNRWTNLRRATSSQNMVNRGLQADNTTGFKGVFRIKKTGRYMAHITYKRKREHIGCFATAEEAFSAYCARARELHGDFHRLT